ncbi:MAG: HD domain-containing protein [Planctomycetota bacterium]
MFSPGVEDALRVAEAAHAGQTRKGPTGAPYIIHPMHVALLVARWGYGDVEIQAAILHDVVEDCDGWTVARLEQLFGAKVASVVDELSEDKSCTWEERKQHAVDSIPGLSPEACVVKAADKLHNLRSLLAELTQNDDQDDVWSRFTGGRERTLQMDRLLIDALCERVGDGVASELQAGMSELERL